MNLFFIPSIQFNCPAQESQNMKNMNRKKFKFVKVKLLAGEQEDLKSLSLPANMKLDLFQQTKCTFKVLIVMLWKNNCDHHSQSHKSVAK